MSFIHKIKPTHEVYGEIDSPPLIMTCEHASNLIPFPHKLTEQERLILNDHWGWDIGISALTKSLCRPLNALSVHSRFSRLVCDANRTPDHQTLMLKEADGVPLSFNTNQPADIQRQRVESYHVPYHDAIDDILSKQTGHQPILLSMHSFTPVWKHELRQMDIAVLFDKKTPLNQILFKKLKTEFFAAQNEPYSGMSGMMYSATRHGNTHNVPYVELEINQYLLSTPERISNMTERLLPCFKSWLAELRV